MREMRKSRGILGVLLAFAVAVSCLSCDNDSEELSVLVAPNPVAGFMQAGAMRWEFTVAIANWTGEPVTITGYYGEVLNSDTGCTNERALHTNRPYTGVRIAPGDVYSYEAAFDSTCFVTAENVRDYVGVTDDGETFVGSVRIYFR